MARMEKVLRCIREGKHNPTEGRDWGGGVSETTTLKQWRLTEGDFLGKDIIWREESKVLSQQGGSILGKDPGKV